MDEILVPWSEEYDQFCAEMAELEAYDALTHAYARPWRWWLAMARYGDHRETGCRDESEYRIATGVGIEYR